ncbi:hypothetical protein LZ30DRAFT_317803 [Colletotrichum cereale]|nr:hypothetical protein LZ30DRAFT_317803 [Colletotrichum cereale]
MTTTTATSPLVSPAQTNDAVSPSASANASSGDEKTVPAVCFDICNNALIETSNIGRVPSMCDTNSDFWRGYQECISCLGAEANDANTTIETYIDPVFKQFIDYCASQMPQPSYPSTLMTTRTVLQFVDITAIDGKVQPGVLRTWIVTDLKAEFTGLPTVTSDVLSPYTTKPTGTAPANTSATVAEEPSQELDKAWIAGPVIGVVTAILLALAGLWFLRRRSRRALYRSAAEGNGYGKEEFIKGQLHSHCVQCGHAAELEDSRPKAMPVISADEIPAQDAPVSYGRHEEGVTGRSG